jgi:hypothetical protein
VLFCFDPWRSAILLVAGDKAGRWNRWSQIEAGDVSTQDVLRRYITALGGTLHLVADFGDEQLKVG